MTRRSPGRPRRASPKKIGPIGTGTAGLSVRENDSEPAQILPARLALVASAWLSSGLPATAHRSAARTGFAAVPGPEKARPVWSGSRRAKDAAASMAGSQRALGPPRGRRESLQHSAGDGRSGEFDPNLRLRLRPYRERGPPPGQSFAVTLSGVLGRHNAPARPQALDAFGATTIR